MRAHALKLNRQLALPQSEQAPFELQPPKLPGRKASKPAGHLKVVSNNPAKVSRTHSRRKAASIHSDELLAKRRARTDRSTSEEIAELDGYKATPILNFTPAPDADESAAGRVDLVHRWETDKRYYEVRIERDLWGIETLLVAHGGKGTRLGAMRVVAAGFGQVRDAYQAIKRRREAHGYRFVS